MPLIPRIRKQTIALIDSANLAFRFAHSFKGQMIKTTATSQVSSGIIYGMLDTIWKLRELHKIDIAIFLLEGSHENNPRRKHPIYKSKRPTSISVDITAEMNLIKELAPLLGIPVAIPTIGEADDGIAFFTNKFCSFKYENLICSADHDMQVLLNKNTKIIKSANKKNKAIPLEQRVTSGRNMDLLLSISVYLWLLPAILATLFQVSEELAQRREWLYSENLLLLQLILHQQELLKN